MEQPAQQSFSETRPEKRISKNLVLVRIEGRLVTVGHMIRPFRAIRCAECRLNFERMPQRLHDWLSQVALQLCLKPRTFCISRRSS